MGNFRSGRWGDYRRKVTVEDCMVLDIEVVKTYLLANDCCSGTISWPERGAISFTVLRKETNDGDPVGRTLEISYFLGDKRLRQSISFDVTQLRFGQRLWFKCPGADCARRVKMLYLPPGESRFLCRDCHVLAYRSTQAPKAKLEDPFLAENVHAINKLLKLLR